MDKEKRNANTVEVWKEFSENIITHSAAHHLLAIHELIEKRGYARVTDVARSLDITTGSASSNLKGLKQKGLVSEDENKFVVLTLEGQKLAEDIYDRRKLLIKFFNEVLGLNKDLAKIDACKIEHLLSEEATQGLKKYLDKL